MRKERGVPGQQNTGGALDTGTEGGRWDLCIWGPWGRLLLWAGEAAVPSWPGPPLPQDWGPGDPSEGWQRCWVPILGKI